MVIRNNPGYIYCVKVGQHIKVGMTVNADKRRLKAYDWFPPFKYKLVYWKKVYDYQFFEKLLHEELKEYRVKGEWFKLPKDWHKYLAGVLDIFCEDIGAKIKKLDSRSELKAKIHALLI